MLIDNVIGIVGAVYKGNYSSTTTYEYLNVVTYDGSSYICIKEEGCTGITPTNTTYWQLMAKKGEFTEEDKEEFKQAVVQDSKTEITEHTEAKKTELDNYTTEKETSLKNELDAYETTKETELDKHKSTLETEMTITKNSLVEEIEEAQNGFDTNVTAKTNSFNNNVIEQTNTFNNNVTAKTEEFDENANTKKTEYNENATAKLQEYNNNHTAKMNEFNENAESYATELEELAQQMPWNTTEISENIHVSDSAKYSRNKLNIFGNLKQEMREGYNLLKTEDFLFNNGTLSQNGLTATINTDGSITVNGTATETTYLAKHIKDELDDGDYYFYNFNNVAQSASTYYMVIQGNKSTGYTTADYYNQYGYQSNNFTKDTSVYDRTFKCIFVFTDGFVANNLILYPVISKTVQTVYEQYGAMPSINYPSEPVVATGVQKITKCEKNFWKFECAKITPSNQNWFFFDGNSGAWGTNIQNKTQCYIKLEPGFYAFSYINAYNCSNLHIIDNNEKILINTTFPKTIELTEDTYIIPRFRNTENNIETYVEGLQIEKVSSLSDEATGYEQYNGEEITLDLGTIKLCKVGNYSDYIYKNNDNGLWYKKERIYEHVLKGTETYGKSYGDNLFNTQKVPDTIAKSGGVSNYYKYNDIQTGIDAGTINSDFAIQVTKYPLTETKIFMKNEKFSDIASFKAHLQELYNANIPVKFYYPLLTPNDIQITDTTLIEQLEKLYKLALARGTNNIFVESENGVTTELQLEYMQDLQSKLNTLEAMIVSNASEEV